MSHLTGLTWKNGITSTLYGEIDCAYTVPDYGVVYSNGTNMMSKTTTISCTTPQWNTSPPISGVENNSVFFENADKNPSTDWYNDLTSSVSVTNALEYKDSYNSIPVSWSSSHNVDDSCNGVTSKTQVITGSLASGTTATWSSLNKQPVAC